MDPLVLLLPPCLSIFDSHSRCLEKKKNFSENVRDFSKTDDIEFIVQVDKKCKVGKFLANSNICFDNISL